MSENMVEIYRNECAEQPRRLADLLHAYAADAEVRHQMADLRKVIPLHQPLLWLGMGASYASALAGVAALWLKGKSSFTVEASEWLYFADKVQGQTEGPILVTTSGESVELVELGRQSEGKPNIVICNKPGSPCWSNAQIRFPLIAGPELANATKTYTNSTAACIILASELAGGGWQIATPLVLESFSRALEDQFGQRQQLLNFAGRGRCIEFMGRGPSFAGALMGALCLREMAGVNVHAYSAGSFRHGPSLSVNESHVAVIAALGRTAALGLRLAQECLDRGGQVILVADCAIELLSDRLLPISIPPVPEPWEALTSVLAGQALTLAMIEGDGSSFVRVHTTSE